MMLRQNMMARREWRTLGVLLVLVCGCVSWGRAADPFEPTVTRREATLLQRVSARVATNDLQGAVVLLQDANLEKGSAALNFALGNVHFLANELEESAAAYRAAVKKHPKFRRAIMNLGRVYLSQEKTADAIDVYREVVKDGQASSDILILMGRALLMEGNSVSAETAFRHALLLQPRDAQALAGLATCLLRQERYAEGAALTQELIQRDGGTREHWSLRANALLLMAKHGAALRVLETARRLQRIDNPMLVMLGDLYLNAGQPAEAVRVYQEALGGKEPSPEFLLRALDGLMAVGESETDEHAGMLIDRGSKLLTTVPDVFTPMQQRRFLRLKARHLVRIGESEAAEKVYANLVEQDPLDGVSLLALGDLHGAAGRSEHALMAYERAGRVRGIEVRALLRQAELEANRERYGRAVELLEAAQAFEDQPHVATFLEQVRRLAGSTGSR